MSTTLGMRAMRAFAPPHLLQAFENHADLMNLPRVGSDDNVCFPTQQLNVAPAVSRTDSKHAQLLVACAYLNDIIVLCRWRPL